MHADIMFSGKYQQQRTIVANWKKRSLLKYIALALRSEYQTCKPPVKTAVRFQACIHQSSSLTMSTNRISQVIKY